MFALVEPNETMTVRVLTNAKLTDRGMKISSYTIEFNGPEGDLEIDGITPEQAQAIYQGLGEALL